jgi:hypothetical protein
VAALTQATPPEVAITFLAQTETASDWGVGAKNIIFICVFLLVVIAAAIWWLRRG